MEEIITETFPNLLKKKKSHTSAGGMRTPNKKKPNRCKPTHFIMKMQKLKTKGKT